MKKPAKNSRLKIFENQNNLNKNLFDFIKKANLINEGFIILAEDGKILQLNDSIIRLLNLKASNIAGKHIDQILKFIDPANHKTIKNFFSMIKWNKKNSLFVDHLLLNVGKKNLIPVSINLSGILSDDKKKIGTFVIVRDISKEIEVRELLIERERKFSTFVSNLPGFIYRCKNDHNWTMEFISDGCKKITGYNPNDFINNNKLTFNDIILPEYQKIIWNKWQNILKQKEYFEFEYPIISKDSKIKWVWERGRGIYNEKNKLLYLEGFITEITERKKALEELSLKNLVFERSAAANCIADSKGHIIDVNNAFVRLWGYKKKSDFIGKHLSKITANKKSVQKFFHKLNKYGEWNDYFYASRKDKTKFYGYAFASKITNEKKQTIGYQFSVIDETERFIIEQKLKESENRHRTLFDNSPDAIFLADKKTGIILDANTAAVRLMEIPHNKLKGMHQSELHPVNLKKYSINNFKFHLNKLNSSKPIENKIITGSGKVIDVEVVASLVKINGKEVLQGVFRNISKRKLAEEALVESENKFRSLFEHSADGMLLLDEEKFFDCNPAAVKLMQAKSKKQILNFSPAQLSPKLQPDGMLSEEKAKELINKTFKIGAQRFEWIHITKTGKEFPVEVTLTPITIKGKRVLFTIWRDISKRKEIEKEIQDSRNKMQLLIEGTPHLFFYVQDANAKLSYVSPSVKNITGYTVKKWIKNNDWFLSDSPINTIAKARTHLALKGIVSTEPIYIEIFHSNGSKLILEIYERPIFKDGKITGIQGVAHDVTERSKYEENLKQSELSYKGLFDSVSESIYIQDENGLFLAVNDGAVKMYGYSKEELVGKTPEFVSAPGKNNITEVIKCVEKAFNGEIQQFEFWGKRKNGEEFLKDVRLYPGTYFNKRVIIAIANDITEKKKAEKLLRESEERYKLIAENTADNIAVFNLNLDYVYISPSCKKMLGYSPDELKELGLKNLLLPKYLKYIYEIFNEELENEKIGNIDPNRNRIIETEQYCKNGEIIWVESIITFIRDENGIPKNILALSRDVTPRKNAETQKEIALKALKESEEKYRNLVQNINDVLYSISKNGIVTYISGPVQQILGYSPTEIIGTEFKTYLYPADLKKLPSQIKQILRGNIQPLEYRLLDKSGNVHWVKSSGKAFFENGKLSGFQGVMVEITKEKNYEEKLRESEQRYRSISSLTSDYLFATKVNEEGELKLDWVAGSFEKITGYSLPEYIEAGGWIKCLYPEDYDKDNLAMEKLRNNQSVNSTVRTIRKDGSIIWVKSYAQPVWDYEKNKLIGIYGAVQDITGQKKAEIIQNIQYRIADSAAKSKTLSELFEMVRVELSSLINVNNFFIATYDEFTGMLRSDIDKDEVEEISEWPAKGSMTGYVIEQGKSLLLTKKQINQLIESGKAGMIGVIPEIWLGVPFVVGGKINGVLVVQSYDNPNAYTQTSVEILEIVAHELSIYMLHKKAEEEALKLSTAVIQSPVIVVITSPNGAIEFVNPKFTEVTGYTFEEAKNKNPRILKSGLHSAEFYKDLWQTLYAGKLWSGEFHNRKKNGELYWENALISPILNEKGEIAHIVAVKEDITEKKKMIEDLIKAKEAAEEMNRVKSSFFANMSHELRTPLVGILGFSSLLMDELKDSPDTLNMAKSIHASGGRLLETLNQLLNFSKLEASKTDINIKTNNVVELLIKCFGFFTALAQNKKLEYNLIVESDDIHCRIDSNLFFSIFSNLINNAIKFTDKGSVTVSASVKDDFAIIEVADTGIGISEEKQKLIWEEFRQVSEGYNRSFEGTGLGLTLAKKYTEMMKGSISVESKENVGTKFIVKLPLAKKTVIRKESEVEKSDANDFVPSHQDKRLLYVEDDEISILFVSTILSPYYKIDFVRDAENALDLIKLHHYDMFLMDINLKRGIDGIELTKLIRKVDEYKNVPIVALTAFALGQDKDEFLSKGMTHYLSKPFSKTQLLQLVNEAFSIKL